MGGPELVHTLLVTNPARFVAFVPQDREIA
jgi:hypothetical protein